MKRATILLLLLGLLGSALLFAARAAQPARAQVIVLSNSSPHLSVIDAGTNRVIKTADVPQMTSWAWNDDNNYYDGKHLWLGMRNPDTSEVQVVLLDLDSLQVNRRIPLGKDEVTVYIGKPSRSGRIFVAKHTSGQLAVIDAKTFAVKTVSLPVDGGVACDIDVALGSDRVERAFVPTRTGNTLLSIDTKTLQVLRTLRFPNTQPYMLTASSNGAQVWVEEAAGNSVAVVNPVTLELIQRMPTGKGPIIGTFSPDETRHFVGHAGDTAVIAYDTRTFKETWRSPVGAYPQKLGVDPGGAFVYAILTQEGAVAILDASTGKVTARVSLGTNPTGIFVRRVK
jgi:YVTN family beta-propeller protein